MTKAELLDHRLTEFDKGTRRAESLRKLRREFPDLGMSPDRWRTERLTSAKVNPIATYVEMKYNCGCCPDSPLEARPYVVVDGEMIYAEPDCYTVGEANCGNGVIVYDNWEERLISNGVSQEAIDRVRSYLGANKPEDTDDDPVPCIGRRPD